MTDVIPRRRVLFPCCADPRHVVTERDAHDQPLRWKCLTCEMEMDAQGWSL